MYPAGTGVRVGRVLVIFSISAGWISVCLVQRLTTMAVSSALRTWSRSHIRTIRLAARTATTSGVVTSTAVSAISTAAAFAPVIWVPQSTTTSS